MWGEAEFLSRASRFLDGVLPVVVAGKAQRLSNKNAGLDKSRRLIAELLPGTVVFMKNDRRRQQRRGALEPSYGRGEPAWQ